MATLYQSLNTLAPARVAEPVLSIRGDQPCYYCRREVGYLSAAVIFDLQYPRVVGAAHIVCAYFDLRYAQFSVNGTLVLNVAETTLLANFYYRLFNLPGEGHPRAALRHCLAALLLDYPARLNDLPFMIDLYKTENPQEALEYPGDLESDCYVLLSKVGQAARDNPLATAIDFS
jgi:hypothetical protein